MKIRKFASLQTPKLAAFKQPQLKQYLEYLAEILHGTYRHVGKHASKFSRNLEMVTRKIFADLAHFKWNDPDKNFDNIIAAKYCGSTASNFTLITCRSPIYYTIFLLGIDRRSTSSNF